MSEKKTAVIIGAGIIGCAIALQLGRRGYQTINIDKNPEVGYGSTSHSCAVVRFSYSSLASTHLAWEGYHYWKDWAAFLGVEDERGLAKYHRCGHLMLRIDEQDRQSVLEFYRALDIPHEFWDNETIHSRLPLFDLKKQGPAVSVDDPAFWESSESDSELAGGVFAPDAGYIGDPQLAAHNLRRAVEHIGGQFLLKQAVTDIQSEAGQVTGVVLSDGTHIDAQVVVNAAGPYSRQINALAGVAENAGIGTRALRREVYHLSSPPNFDFENKGVMTSDGDLYVYFRPETGNKVTIGSGDPECDEQVWVDDPDTMDRGFTDRQWQAQVYRGARRIPELPIPSQAQGVVDMYDVSDDWVPIYDKSDLGGYYLAIGTSGHQFKNAGVVGDLMATLIDSCEQGQDHDRSPVEYACKYTGGKIDLAVFSRLRQLNTESSYSVRG